MAQISCFEILEDNTEEIKKATKEQILNALELCGIKAEDFATINIKNNGNVDTGLLKNSITYCVAGNPPHKNSYVADTPKEGVTSSGSYEGTEGSEDELAVYVGTNVKYGPAIELGTSTNNGPYPFLKPAIADHMDTYRKIFETVLKK